MTEAGQVQAAYLPCFSSAQGRISAVVPSTSAAARQRGVDSMVAQGFRASPDLAQQLPACIGRKAIAVRALQLLKPRYDGVHAASARVLKRTAPKRSEPGAKDDAGVDQVRILHDALAKHGDGLVYEG